MSESLQEHGRMDEEPEPFSIASARLAIQELFEALPKSRQLEHIGALNEALLVLGRCVLKETN